MTDEISRCLQDPVGQSAAGRDIYDKWCKGVKCKLTSKNMWCWYRIEFPVVFFVEAFVVLV